MRTTIRTIAAVLALAIPMQRAQAQLLTSDFGGTQATRFICADPDEYGQCVLTGTLQVGANGFDVIFRAGSMDLNLPTHAVIGNGQYGLKANGFWDGASGTYVGIASQVSSTSGLMFHFAQPVYQVGAWLNYADPTTPVFIRAYGQYGELLSEYVLQETAPISTPNMYNKGAFRGIADATGIWTFELFGGEVVTRDLFANGEQPAEEFFNQGDDEGDGAADQIFLEQAPTVVTPEPGTYVLVAAGLAGLGFLKRRRRA